MILDTIVIQLVQQAPFSPYNLLLIGVFDSIDDQPANGVAFCHNLDECIPIDAGYLPFNMEQQFFVGSTICNNRIYLLANLHPYTQTNLIGT